MMKTRLGVAILVAAGLVGSTFTAEARSHKHKHHSAMTSGANMKSDKTGTTGGGTSNGSMAPSGQGNAGSGTAPASSGK